MLKYCVLFFSQGAFYIFPNVEAYIGKGKTADGFDRDIETVSILCEYLLESASVALVPGYVPVLSMYASTCVSIALVWTKAIRTVVCLRVQND